MSNEDYNFFGLTGHGAASLEAELRVRSGKPSTIIDILKIVDNCIEKQKNEEKDLHNLGMLDGMLVIQAAVNGNPWPL